MINKNGQKLKELGSPKDKFALEKGRKCLHLEAGIKVETKRGCSHSIITLQGLQVN